MSVENGAVSKSRTTGKKFHKNTLTMAKFYKLGTWLNTNKDKINQQIMEKKEIARMATKELGFFVSDGNIAGCNEQLEIGIVFKRQASIAANVGKNRLLKRVEVLRQALAELYNKCGESVPQDIGVDW